LNVAAVGDSTFIAGFELIGIKGFHATEAEEARKSLKEIIDSGNYALIILPDRFVEASRDTRTKIAREGKITPLFAFLPDHTGIKGKRVEELKKAINLAVGTELNL
jgi:vacuolar-type H+-ATPase subunit F/Vma7